MKARVLHLGDIAGTSRSVIEVARAKGLNWDLRDVPAGRGANPLVIILRRLRDLVTVRTLRPKPDILHINYGVSGYYGWGRRKVVLHLHGTDVRADMQSPLLGPVVRHSIRTADVVLYSSPDLEPAVRELRSDAQWFPAPLPPAASIRLSKQESRSTRIFFASRWDDSKGAPSILRLVKNLQKLHPSIDLVGLDWGTYVAAAGDTGMTLLPLMSTEDFRQEIANADVVVGQVAFGALGLSDLEAMAQARPLVAKFTLDSAYGRSAPLFNTALEPAIDLIERILSDPEAAAEVAEAGREWALEHHGADGLEARLEGIYQELLR